MSLKSIIMPVGSILAYLPGYFTGAANAGFTQVELTLSAGWAICNGSAVNDPKSPIFNGSGRYLPDLTDQRFLMGSSIAGSVGGNNDMEHTHSVTPLAHTHDIPAHYHTVGAGAGLTAGAAGNHYHTFTLLTTSADSSGSYPSVGDDNTTGTGTTGYSGDHSHNVTGSIGLVTGGVNGNALMMSGSASSGIVTSSVPSYTENRPRYLSVLYIMRIK